MTAATAKSSKSSLLEKLPASVGALINPIFYVSIAVHGIALLAPIPSQQGLEIPPESDYEIKVTQIPPATPSPKLSDKENKAGSATPAAQSSASNSSRSYQTSSFPATSSSTTSSYTTTTITRTDNGSPTTSKTFSGSFTDFPHYNPSETGCYDRFDCRSVKDTSLNKVDEYFAKVLKEKDFGITSVKSEVDIRVYRIQGNLENKYLTVMADGNDTVYVLSVQQNISLQALRGAGSAQDAAPSSASSTATSPSPTPAPTVAANPPDPVPLIPLAPVPRQLNDVLQDVIPIRSPIPEDTELLSYAYPQHFEYPNLFFVLPEPTATAGTPTPAPSPATIAGSPVTSNAPQTIVGIHDSPLMVLARTPEEFYNRVLKRRLEEVAESITPVEKFAGGDLYELAFTVRQQPVKLYLNLVPMSKERAPDKKDGLIVVLWTRDPRPLEKELQQDKTDQPDSSGEVTTPPSSP